MEILMIRCEAEAPAQVFHILGINMLYLVLHLAAGTILPILLIRNFHQNKSLISNE